MSALGMIFSCVMFVLGLIEFAHGNILNCALLCGVSAVFYHGYGSASLSYIIIKTLNIFSEKMKKSKDNTDRISRSIDDIEKEIKKMGLYNNKAKKDTENKPDNGEDIPDFLK